MIGEGDGKLVATRTAELRAASEEAEAISQAGAAHAEQIVAQARVDAAELIRRRCAPAERLAEREERERLAEARGQARGAVLRARQSVLSEARMAVHTAVSGLVGHPRLERLFERLADDARERLAPAASPFVVEIAAAPEGGFVARAGSREIDYSLPTHVDRYLDALADELERLWQ